MNLVNELKNIKQSFKYFFDTAFPQLVKKKEFKDYNFTDDTSVIDSLSEPEFYFINKLIEPGKVVVDIGANMGLYVYVLENSGLHKHIVAFEPIPNLFKRLSRFFPNVSVYDYAVSDHAGESIFKIPFINSRMYDTRGTLQTLKEVDENKSLNIKVRIISLDDFAKKNLKDPISFIKIDVEGHEISTLKGCKEVILKDKPLLMVEIEKRHHPDIEIESIFQMIQNFGYTGYFFNRADRKFYEVGNFSLNIHQNEKNIKSGSYINNFLFASSDDLGFIKRLDQVTAQLKK